jgi:hypothetical protein
VSIRQGKGFEIRIAPESGWEGRALKVQIRTEKTRGRGRGEGSKERAVDGMATTREEGSVQPLESSTSPKTVSVDDV